jgi:succinate dehydrogenase flavin-adding protein (antitoxin of CptAB toxin-antitoxin module)
MAETATQAGLAGLASQMPVRNKAVADQQRAARMLQLQQAVSQLAPQQAPTATQAAGMGASIAQQAGTEQVNRAKDLVQQSAQLGKLGQQETALTNLQTTGALQQQAQQESLDQATRLASLDDAAKREMFDSQLQFKKDQADNTLFSERQLADYKRLSAQGDEDLKNWAQRSNQLHARNVQVLQAISDRLNEALTSDYLKGRQKLDQQTKLELAQMKRDNDIRLAKARADAANTGAMWGALGGAATMAGGALIATGVGAPVGIGLMAAGAGASYYGSQEAAKKGGNV